MKKLVLTLAGALFLCSASALAQQPKFGRINIQEVVSMMPERMQAQEQLKKINDDYAEMLEVMQVELNNKVQEYQKNMSTYTDAIRQLKESELQDMNARIQQLYATANQELEAKSNELIAPIIEKAQEAVKKIGRDNGFTIVFDETSQPMAYYDEKTVVDILPLVKQALNIPADATPETAMGMMAAPEAVPAQ